MNNFVHIIVAVIISLTFSVGVFANSGEVTPTNKSQTWNILKTESWDEEWIDDIKKIPEESATEAKKEKIKQEISSYIIDSYKAQWDKILKDIDQTLQKTNPDKRDRIEAYKKIRISLEARRIKNNQWKKISETSKMIINEFLWHIIESIDKKVQELS